MEWRLFADLAEIAGERRIPIEGDPDTVGDALDALLDSRPDLRERVLEESGALEEHINLLHNGTSLSGTDRLDTPVEPGDELALFPPVSGGDGRVGTCPCGSC